MGRLVQPPTPLRTLRRHATRRARSCLLPSPGNSATRRVLKQVSLRTRRQDSLVGSRAAQDHLIPTNKTSLGLHAWGNIVPACADCNGKKQGSDWRDFII